jgi:hypothetical protein
VPLPGDAVARAHAHHLLDFLFGIIVKLGDLNTPCLLIPFEDVRTETDTRFAIRALGSIDDRTFHCVFLVGFTSLFVLPCQILPISEARAEFTRRSYAVLSPAQAAPGLAAHLALFAIGAFLFC